MKRPSWKILAAAALTLLLGACDTYVLRPPAPLGPPRPVTLTGRLPLQMDLPRGYALRAELGTTFDVFHVWRLPPVSQEKDTSMGIFIGRPVVAYCEKKEASHQPAAFRSWKVNWDVCGQSGTRQRVWEAHVRGLREPVHIFIIGPDTAESERLRAIAETLHVG